MNKILILIIFFGLISQIYAEDEASDVKPLTPANAEGEGSAQSQSQTQSQSTKLPKPITRTKTPNPGLPNESSSFIGDPDNIDVLKPNRENIKEDEEPVLEDIKQVLDAPKIQEKVPEPEIIEENDKPKPPSQKKKKIVQESPPQEKHQGKLKKQSVPKSVPKKSHKVVRKTPQKDRLSKVTKISLDKSDRENLESLRPDDPDLKLEKKFNSIYKAFNVNPTSIDAWQEATSKQAVREYIVQKGDTLWSISNILFGDPLFWPKIWAINKQGILNPHFILPNSKIFFYMGDEEAAPTLSVGDKAKVEEVGSVNKEMDNGVSDEDSATESENDSQKSVKLKKKNDLAAGKKLVKSKGPSALPDSLPLFRNDEYFAKKVKNELKIDFSERALFGFENITDIFITDKPIKTEVMIQLSETAKFRCYQGRILKEIRYVGELAEEYEIYEPMNTFTTSVGPMYVYRAYGQAKPYLQNNLEITNCEGLLTTNLVFIPKGSVEEWKNNKISLTDEAMLVGGTDVNNQELFIVNQLAYVDFGGIVYEPGQVYKTISKITDKINGQVKIVGKYGSFGVVMITDMNDQLEVGDKILLK